MGMYVGMALPGDIYQVHSRILYFIFYSHMHLISSLLKKVNRIWSPWGILERCKKKIVRNAPFTNFYVCTYVEEKTLEVSYFQYKVI